MRISNEDIHMFLGDGFSSLVKNCLGKIREFFLVEVDLVPPNLLGENGVDSKGFNEDLLATGVQKCDAV